MALISIIIPCYNVENFIDRCVSSLVSQTIGIENLEIILVNDASPDNTLSKLYEWEKKYPESIMVITYDENIRQGGARNVGLTYATSDYIGFVDSDDWVEPDMYEYMYKRATETGADAVRCRLVRDDGTKVICRHTDNIPEEYYAFEKRNDVYFHATLSSGLADKCAPLPCGLYRREPIFDHGIYFPEKTAYEDNFFLSLLKLYIKDTLYLDVEFYHYFINPNSTIMSRNASHHLDRLNIEIAIIEEYRNRGIFEQFRPILFSDFILRYYLNSLFIFSTRFDDIPYDLNIMKETVAGYFPEYTGLSDILPSFSASDRLLIEALLSYDYYTYEMQLQLKLHYLEVLLNK